MTRIEKILVDTSIIAYVVARGARAKRYRVRALLAEELIGMCAQRGLELLLYEEQIFEVQRAIDDIVITGVLGVDVKRQVVQSIHEDFRDVFERCVAIGVCKLVHYDPSIVECAARLYKRLEECPAVTRRERKHRGITGDLKLLCVADAENAAVVTADCSTMYRFYARCLHDKLRVPSVYCLVVDENEGRVWYRVCGSRVDVLEEVLRRVAPQLSLDYRGVRLECRVAAQG